MKNFNKLFQQIFIAVLCLGIQRIAYAVGPFSTGSSALSTDILAILTPVAVIGVMAFGAFAWFGRVSWGHAAGGMIGIVLVFGSQQIVTWVRGLFGV